MNTTTIKVARVGDTVQEVAVQDTMTVQEALQAAGYEDATGTIYATDSSGENKIVQAQDNVNGFTKLVLTTNVKGGL